MFKTNFIKAGVAIAAVAGVASMGVSSAQADPVGTPATPRTYQGVGSDTIQDVWNDLVNNPGYGGINPGPLNSASISSWNADPIGGYITPVSTKYLRPTGSGNGIKALSAAWSGGTCTWPVDNAGVVTNQALNNADVSFARSSNGPGPSGTDLTFIPFARDAVSVGYKPATGESAVTFSRAELKAIYGGSDENTTGTITYDVATGLPKKGGNILHPYLPQSASGTRGFFLGAQGANVSSLATYVVQSESYLENRGTVLSVDDGDTTPAPDRSLIPFSAAQWIYQQHKGSPIDTTGGLLIADIDHDNNTGTAALTAVVGSGVNAAPGTLFGNLSAPPAIAFARDTYSVVPTSQFDDDPDLIEALVDAAGQETVIEGDGFGVLDYADDPGSFAYPTSAFVCA